MGSGNSIVEILDKLNQYIYIYIQLLGSNYNTFLIFRNPVLEGFLKNRFYNRVMFFNINLCSQFNKIGSDFN